MCRLVLFAGTCTRCNESLTWADLSQQLSCLEAKNADKFGSCRRGVDVETHAFDQECDACAGEDEGVAGMDFGEQDFQQYHHQYQQYQQYQHPSSAAYTAAGSSSSASIPQPGSSKRGRDEGEGRKKKKART
ncbi:hypothetical protein CPAR01_12861 [Colletotrichum paranaense]|nr:uncharacterized protein CPAR01_12861 [Colletotrichum paranaense]XP_060385608.1 uncharacterized protein CTAM01_03366 [Colletotrichum tamarilloi]XP_060399704.1 uncharacterized protein CABS01_10167 [Colletotrichum abscissum]KAK0376694.1 hypothetical protein CLIM01_05962 [Colletotrichum limetticola]KAK1458879.1 hypothetical protein CMEL01_01878 [Colletotrichum melonis]KAK1719645.1 hypothetical protein BDP67DRAFT_485781 [Colletotrichum lupini]KXH42055.1 hypothetical protein CNYM01_08405 [Collet